MRPVLVGSHGMALKLIDTAVVDNSGGNDAIALSSLVTLTGTGNPAYLVVNALDRDEYTVSGTGETGVFLGNWAMLGLSPIGGDGFGAGIVFTWQAATGQYVNATYGDLSQLVFGDSSSPNDVTDISFFGTSNYALALADADNAYALMQQDAAGYIGSATIATSSVFASPPPSQATPDGVVAAALAMVGQDWNDNGCWVLASTIAAEAGAGLPVQSTEVDRAGAANGEWVMVYDGPVSRSATWQNLVSAGDMVVFATSASTGHITTCVSGSGTSAMLVDNVTYIGPGGAIQNSADDGSANDVVIAPPHPASQEFNGIDAGSVVIYALDTPVITARVTSETLDTGAKVQLSTLFTAADPGHKAITAYQVYNVVGSDSILLNGAAEASSEEAPVSASSLAALALEAGTTPASDTLEIRASNGTYWGDWLSLAVTVVTPPPVLAAKLAAQTWLQGASVDFALPPALFKDPQGAAITYAATGVAGAALPAWLSFNPVSNVFSGTVPAGLEKFSVVVTATDALGGSASTTFAVNVPAAAPQLTTPESAVTLTAGHVAGFALLADSFSDPQSEKLTYKATLSTGAALPAWLKFSAASASFSGTAPAKATTLEVKVTATDTSNLSASELFAITVAPAASSAFSLADWSGDVAPAADHDVTTTSGISVPFHGMFAVGALDAFLHIGHNG